MFSARTADACFLSIKLHAQNALENHVAKPYGDDPYKHNHGRRLCIKLHLIAIIAKWSAKTTAETNADSSQAPDRVSSQCVEQFWPGCKRQGLRLPSSISMKVLVCLALRICSHRTCSCVSRAASCIVNSRTRKAVGSICTSSNLKKTCCGVRMSDCCSCCLLSLFGFEYRKTIGNSGSLQLTNNAERLRIAFPKTPTAPQGNFPRPHPSDQHT